MTKKFNAVVNGKSYEVEIGDLSTSPISVIVNGNAYSVDMGTSEISAAPVVSVPAPSVVVPQAAPQPVPAAPVQPAGAGVSIDEVRAPMQGVIRDIAVKPGQKVSAGQQLLALEAMKMKNAIRSPREGTIASVDVTEGQKVAYGDVMIKFA